MKRQHHQVTARWRWTSGLVLALAIVSGPDFGPSSVPAAPVLAVTLKPHTSAAFDVYVAESDRQAQASLSDPGMFLRVDAAQRSADHEALRKGRVVIERLETRRDGKAIDVPDGMIHHWSGVVFVPGATVDQALLFLQDYDRHQEYFAPAVAGSKLLERDGDRFRMFLRFSLKRVITVVVNSEHEAHYTRLDPGRAHTRAVSTRITQVEDAGTPDERELPVGDDGGYLWRFNTNWRFLERDGGTYVQCESITLTRSIPVLLRPIVRPFVTSIPRDSLNFTLERTRSELMRGAQP
jgi:hypothetical protein